MYLASAIDFKKSIVNNSTSSEIILDQINVTNETVNNSGNN